MEHWRYFLATRATIHLIVQFCQCVLPHLCINCNTTSIVWDLGEVFESTKMSAQSSSQSLSNQHGPVF